LRSRGGTLEIRGDVVVRHESTLPSVPGATIRIGAWTDRFCECAMDFGPLIRAGCAIHGRADQGVTECDSVSERRQSFRFGRACCRLAETKALRGPPHQGCVSGRVGGGDEQQEARVGRKGSKPLREQRFDPGVHGHRCRQAEPARELRRRQPSRQFQQPEGVSTRFHHDLLQDLCIDRRRKERREERSRILMP